MIETINWGAAYSIMINIFGVIAVVLILKWSREDFNDKEK